MYNYPAQSPAKQGGLNDAEIQRQISASDSYASAMPQQQQPFQYPYPPPQPNQQHQYQQQEYHGNQAQLIPQVYSTYQAMPQILYIQDNTFKSALPIQLDNYSSPVFFHCRQCNHDSISLYKVEPGCGTFTCCCFLCCITCTLCPVPFLIDRCKDRSHTCSVCGAQVGRKEFKICS